MQRNRIQSALSDVVIPIEMGVNSGNTHTINFAKRYNKGILVSKLKDECLGLEQYSVIQSLLNNSSKGINIYNDEVSFKKGLSKSDSEQTKIDFL